MSSVAIFVSTILCYSTISTYGKRYVFADLKSVRQSISARAEWTFSPDLSLQFFAQPSVSSYDYVRFKEFKKPKTFEFDYYGEDKGTLELDENGGSTVDPDGGGPAERFTLPNLDFNFRSIRVNAVLRWEFLPGSVLYFVWQQTKDDYVSGLGTLEITEDYRALFRSEPTNTFVLKVTYWLGY